MVRLGKHCASLRHSKRSRVARDTDLPTIDHRRCLHWYGFNLEAWPSLKFHTCAIIHQSCTQASCALAVRKIPKVGNCSTGAVSAPSPLRNATKDIVRISDMTHEPPFHVTSDVIATHCAVCLYWSRFNPEDEFR